MNALLKNINVLNIVLAVLAVVLFFIWVYPLLHTNIRIEIPQAWEEAAGSGEEGQEVTESLPISVDYAIVAGNNLFHPERRLSSASILKEDQSVERPDILYFGSVITGEKRIAYIEDKKNPYATPGRGKRQTPLAQGAIIGGYTLKEVNPENIVLVRGDDIIVIKLRDEKDRKPGVSAGTLPLPPGQVQTQQTMPRPPGAVPPPVPSRPAIRN